MATSILAFLSFCSFTTTILLLSKPALVGSVTLKSDIEVLRSLQSAIDPNTILESSYLSSWNFKVDPCENSGNYFLGILCSITEANETTRITTIDLDGMDYDGFLTKDIGNLTELTTLNLGKNKFRGPIPDSLPSLRKLTRLDLSKNVFTGGILAGLRNLKRIQYIDFSYNKITGSIPAWVSNYKSLTFLSLSNNGLSGRIPSLAGLWQLATLDLSGNQFFGPIPDLPVRLRALSLSHNILSGHISLMARLQGLKRLDLSDNRFTGAIKTAVLALPEVTFMNISVNWLTTMEVIKFSGRPTKLQVLDVQENRLHGRLPANLATMGNLTSINLSRNQFSGAIPVAYGAKLGVEWKSLYLDHNFLVGGVPLGFRKTGVNGKGDLSYNCLRCPIDVGLCHGGQRAASECAGQA